MWRGSFEIVGSPQHIGLLAAPIHLQYRKKYVYIIHIRITR